MGWLTAIGRKMTAARFRRKHLQIIQKIQADYINTIIDELVEEGWEVADQYDTTSSLNQQGECIIRRGQSTLTFTLDLKVQGEIVGPARIISSLAKQYKLVALDSPQY